MNPDGAGVAANADLMERENKGLRPSIGKAREPQAEAGADAASERNHSACACSRLALRDCDLTICNVSNADAYGWIRRHAKYSHAQCHYEPRGSGVRFAGESVADIYPWTKIFAAFAICAVGFTLLQVAQRAEAKLAEPGIQQTTEVQIGSEGESELVDLKLR